jgi:preprotein translocase SecE subunit
VAYKSDQGRYVRMASFWCLFLILAYGIFGGFVHFANGIFGDWFEMDTSPWFTQVPLLGDFTPGTLAGVVLQVIVGLLLHRLLSRPKTVEYLIETEAEMNKVHWPSWKDTRTGTVAVIITVMVMLLYLMAVDYICLESFKRLFTINLGG